MRLAVPSAMPQTIKLEQKRRLQDIKSAYSILLSKNIALDAAAPRDELRHWLMESYQALPTAGARIQWFHTLLQIDVLFYWEQDLVVRPIFHHLLHLPWQGRWTLYRVFKQYVNEREPRPPVRFAEVASLSSSVVGEKPGLFAWGYCNN